MDVKCSTNNYRVSDRYSLKCNGSLSVERNLKITSIQIVKIKTPNMLNVLYCTLLYFNLNVL